jgi:hypothetical protein
MQYENVPGTTFSVEQTTTAEVTVKDPSQWWRVAATVLGA